MDSRGTGKLLQKLSRAPAFLQHFIPRLPPSPHAHSATSGGGLFALKLQKRGENRFLAVFASFETQISGILISIS